MSESSEFRVVVNDQEQWVWVDMRPRSLRP